MSTADKSPESLKRLRALLALHGSNVSRFASAIGISDSHLVAVVAGERRPSDRLISAIKAELGQDGWSFVRAGRLDAATPTEKEI